MLINTTDFEILNQFTSKHPLFVIEVDFSINSDGTDIVCFTSDASAITNPAATQVINGVVKIIRGASQSISPAKAVATIGSLSVELVDNQGVITNLLRDKLGTGQSLRNNTIKAFLGYKRIKVTDPVLVYADYVQLTTQIIIGDTFENGIYKLKCSDIQREIAKNILDPRTTNLSATITDTDTTINVLNTTDFDLIQRSAGDSEFPSQLISFIRINDEVISYTSKTISSFTGCVRGVLGTTAANHEVDLSQPATGRQEVLEHIRLDGNAISIIHQLLTGVEPNSISTVPTHYHLGIPNTFIRTTDFVNIGLDLFNQFDHSEGVPFRIDGLTREDGKRFIDLELRNLGLFMPVFSDGSLGLRRIKEVLTDSSYSQVVDDSVILATSSKSIARDFTTVINDVTFRWNFERIQERFTRRHRIFDTQSNDLYPGSDPVTYDLRSTYGNSSTIGNILSRYNAIRTASASPGITFTLTLMPSFNNTEVGDIHRVITDKIRDYNNPNNSFDRSCQVNKVQTDWITGRVTITYFASTSKAGPINDNVNNSLPDAYYSSKGVDLQVYLDANFPGSYTISSGEMTINSNITLPGNNDMTASGAIYYWLDDLTIGIGVVVNATLNTRIRCMGFFTNNGVVDLTGQGHVSDAAFDPASNSPTAFTGTLGLIGSSFGGPFIQRIPGSALSRDIFPDAGIDLWRSTAQINEGNSVIPEFNLKLNAGNDDFIGLPTDWRGSTGLQGGSAVPLNTTLVVPGRVIGGRGGNSGGGFLVECRGFASAVGSNIITDGVAGLFGNTTFFQGTTLNYDHTVHSGKGGAGGPGSFGIFVDGNNVVGTVVSQSEYGDNNEQPPAVRLGRTDSQAFPILPATFSGYWQPPQNLTESARKILYIPTQEAAVQDTPSFVQGVPTFTVTLVLDSPRSPSAGFSSFEIDVIPPPDLDYSHSAIFMREVGLPDWQFFGNADDTFVITPVIADGKQYQIQIRSVNILGTVNDSGPTALITVNDITANPEEVISIPNITGLEIFDDARTGIGGANTNEFVGRDVRIVWRRSSVDNSFGLGSEPPNQGANTGNDSLYFSHYQVDVFNQTTNTLLRTVTTNENEYYYEFNVNAQDNAGVAHRNLRFEVTAHSRQNQMSPMPASIVALNPAPSAPLNVMLSATGKVLNLSFTAPVDLDYVSTNVFIGLSSGFVADASSLLTTLVSVDDLIISTLADNTTNLLFATQYFIKLQTVDAFGEGGTITSSFSATTEVNPISLVEAFRYEDLNFQPNDPGVNQISWSAGIAISENDGSTFVVDAGNATYVASKLYLYNIPNSNLILSTTSLVVAVTGNILATYNGATNVQSGDNGGAFIDGSTILANTVGANQVIANSITAAEIFTGTLTSASGVFGDVSADVLTTGSLATQIITGGVFQTSLPAATQRIEISESTNEIRMFGDRGDAVTIQLASIGVTPFGLDTVIGLFGDNSSTHQAIVAHSGGTGGTVVVENTSATGIGVLSTVGTGTAFSAVAASGIGILSTSSTGNAIEATTGSGVAVQCENTNLVNGAPLRIVPSVSAAVPTHVEPIGSFWVNAGGSLYINQTGTGVWTFII